MFYDEFNLPPPEHPAFKLSEQPVLKLSAQQALIRQGERPQYLYWLAEGLIRSVYMDDTGKEFTKEFMWEGDVVFLPRGILTEEPLPYSLIALEACQFRQLPIERYRAFVAEDQSWRKYHEKLLAVHLVNKERKEAFLLLNSPEQRAARFHETFPWLVTRVPDYLLASYLGMTPISYSRIKKRLGL